MGSFLIRHDSGMKKLSSTVSHWTRAQQIKSWDLIESNKFVMSALNIAQTAVDKIGYRPDLVTDFLDLAVVYLMV